MRLDRTISLLLRSILRVNNGKKIPILMYHSVTPQIKHRGHPYFCTEITPATFEKHLEFLKSNNYCAIKLSELSSFHFENPIQKPVIITFDDGYRDFYEHALPILEKYQMPATVFVPSGLIDKEGVLEGKPLMTWEQIRESIVHNIEIGSHSHTHRKLVDLSEIELAQELSISKQEIETRTQKKIQSFAYPYRFPEENKYFVNQLCCLLEKCEYKFGVTTRVGTLVKGYDSLIMKRLPVNKFDDSKLFAAKLAGSYDWLNTVQYVTKVFRYRITADFEQ